MSSENEKTTLLTVSKPWTTVERVIKWGFVLFTATFVLLHLSTFTLMYTYTMYFKTVNATTDNLEDDLVITLVVAFPQFFYILIPFLTIFLQRVNLRIQSFFAPIFIAIGISGYVLGTSNWILVLFKLPSVVVNILVNAENALVSHLFEESAVLRQRAYAIVQMGGALGTVSGYAMGSYFYPAFGRFWSFFSILLVCLFAFLCFVLYLWLTRKMDIWPSPTTSEKDWKISKQAFKETVTDKYFIVSLLPFFTVRLYHGVFWVAGIKWVISTLGASEHQVGVLLIVSACFQMLTAFLLTLFRSAFQFWHLALATLALNLVSMLLIPFCPSVWYVLPLEILQEIGYATGRMSMNIGIANVMQLRHNSFYTLGFSFVIIANYGTFFGSFIALFLYEQFSFLACCYITALLQIPCFFIVYMLRNVPESEQQSELELTKTN